MGRNAKRNGVTAEFQVANVFDPLPGRRDVYDRVHPQFVAAFEALRPIYHALNEEKP